MANAADAYLRRTKPARIVVIEPGKTGGPGAMGAKLLAAAVKGAGHRVTHLRVTDEEQAKQGSLFSEGEIAAPDASQIPQADAYYISTIYPRQWLWLRETFRQIGVPMRAERRSSHHPLIVFGGQTSFAPEPIAPFADIVALGDGEVTGVWLADRIRDGLSRDEVIEAAHACTRGYYVPDKWYAGRPTLRRWETGQLASPVVYPGTTERTNPTIEVARGCQSKCAFCPIGWAGGTYRESSQDRVKRQLYEVRRQRSTVNLFAPDYSSVAHVEDLDSYAESLGCRNSGVDARLDRAERHLIRGGSVKSFSFGIEGLSERVRAAIGKPLSADKVRRTMRRLTDVHVKWYVIIGFPGETDDDAREFTSLCDEVMAERERSMSITLTILQPVPHTPLERVDGRWRQEVYDRGMGIREWARGRWEQGLSRVSVSQPKGPEVHDHDVALQRAGRGAAAYLEDSRATDGAVRSGRWREVWAEHGLDPEQHTQAIDALTPVPWHFVDVGTPPPPPSAWSPRTRRLRGAWVSQQRRRGVPEQTHRSFAFVRSSSTHARPLHGHAACAVQPPGGGT